MKVSNRSTIHKRLKCFVEYIAPDKEKRENIKRQSDSIRSCIERNAKEDGLTILSMPYSGSFAVNTGLRRSLLGNDEVEGQDIDLAFILKDEDKDGNPLGCHVEIFKSYLNTCWSDKGDDIETTKSSAFIKFTGTKLQFDTVPLIETRSKNIQKLIRTNGEERQSSVEKHTEFVKSRNNSSNELEGVVKFNECLRLIKWWKYQCQSESTVFSNESNKDKVPSFLLSLLCAHAYDNESVKATYPETLAKWFGFLAHVLRHRKPVVFTDFIKKPNWDNDARWSVIDPMDETNNIVGNWGDFKIDELCDWFERGRDKMNQAIRHDREGDDHASLSCLIDIFGNSINNHCK